MASHSNPTLGFNLPQELGSNDIIKKSRVYLVNPGGRKQEIVTEKPFNLKTEHLELEPRRPFCSLSMSKHLELEPSLMDVVVNKTRPEPLCLSLGITKRREKLIEFLLSRSEELKERALVLRSSLLYLNQESTEPLLDLMVDGSKAKLNHMFSFASEFHVFRNSTRWRKLSLVVPRFSISRFDSEELIDTSQLDEVAVAPPSCPLKPSQKKRNPKIRDREKDLYKRNHLQACESLISLMIGSEQHRQITILSLKKSGGDLSELLTQFSIGIAGISIALFFSLVCDIASRQVPFCANKVFETALSFSLALLSWAVSRLKEAIVDVNRKATKDGEMMNRVERRIKDVYPRAAIVIAMVALRFR